ncbi:MAG: response regulator [Anaerolineae bacterium]
MNVLVVDDNQSGRQLLVDIIQSMNLDVIQAANGYEALEQARAHPPDLIILDVNMPGMSGFEVVQQLKSDSKTSAIPVLLLTALDNVDSRVQGLKLGADDYVTKPFNPRELMERVRTRLRSKIETDELRSMQEAISARPAPLRRAVGGRTASARPASGQLGGTLQQVTVLSGWKASRPSPSAPTRAASEHPQRLSYDGRRRDPRQRRNRRPVHERRRDGAVQRAAGAAGSRRARRQDRAGHPQEPVVVHAPVRAVVPDAHELLASTPGWQSSATWARRR